MLMVMAYQHIPTCPDDDDDDIGNIVKIRKKASKSRVLHLLYKASMFYTNCVKEARVVSSGGDTKEIQNCRDDKSILALFEQILLKICLEHPMGRANCGKQKRRS